MQAPWDTVLPGFFYTIVIDDQWVMMDSGFVVEGAATRQGG